MSVSIVAWIAVGLALAAIAVEVFAWRKLEKLKKDVPGLAGVL